MTNPLEKIMAWRNVVTDQIVSMSGTRAISKEQMEELGRILAASQGYVCVPGDADDRHERELGKLIDERDRCEEIIDCLCDAVLGQGRPEWSSAYGYDDALLEVQEAMFAASKETNRE